MPLLSHDHLSRLHCHSASCSLTANQHASEAVICCDTIGNPVESLSSVGQCCSSRSKLVEQQGKELAAAAALLGSSGCTLQQLWAGLAESSDPACYETQAAERSHEEPGSGQLHSSPPDKESSLQLFLPASYSSSPPLHGH